MQYAALSQRAEFAFSNFFRYVFCGNTKHATYDVLTENCGSTNTLQSALCDSCAIRAANVDVYGFTGFLLLLRQTLNIGTCKGGQECTDTAGDGTCGF